MLKRVRDLPEFVRKPRDGAVAKDAREFCRNQTYEVAEVVIEGKTAKQTVNIIRRYIKTHPEQCKGVKAAVRSGKVYLYREVTR